MKNLTSIILALFFILMLILFIGINKKNKVYKQYISEIEKSNEFLKKENSLLITQIHIDAEYRKKYNHEKDSILKVISELKTNIKDNKKELSKIKNKYENLSLDSLLKIATERYEKDNNINRINTH